MADKAHDLVAALRFHKHPLTQQAADRLAKFEATVAHVWQLSLAAQAEIDDGDLAEINGRLIEIAEAAAKALGKDEL